MEQKRHSCQGKDAVPARGPADAGSRAFCLAGLEPSSGHSSDLIDLPRCEKELLCADPMPCVDDAPQHAQFFQIEIQSPEFIGAGTRIIAGSDDLLQHLQRHAVQSLTKGMALASGDAGRAVEGPAEKFFSDSQDRRW